MPTRELLRRLKLVDDWTKIPKKDKSKKMLWIYFKDNHVNPASRKMSKAWFISIQDEKPLKDICENYKGNVLLRFPNSAFFKKYKGKDKIYVDPDQLFKKDLNKMVKSAPKKKSKKKSKKKIVKSKKKTRKRGGKKIMLKF